MVLRLAGGRPVAHLLLQFERRVTALAQGRGMRRRPLAEIDRILYLHQAPANLRNRECARIQHILRMGRLRNHFVPEIALHAQQMAQGSLGNAGGRIVDINAVEGQVAAEAFRLADRRVLDLVQVAAVAGCHDGIVALPDGLQAAFGPPPRHDRGVRGQAALQDLVPANQPTSMGIQELFDTADQVALEFLHAVQALLLHPALAVRTVVPVPLPGLVAADMDILRGKQVHHLGEHVLHQFERRFLARAKVIRRVLAAHAGNGVHRLPGMAGHLDFRDDGHMPLRGVGDNLPDVVLGEEATVGPLVGAPTFAPLPPGIAHPPGGLRRQLGVRFDLQPPAGGVGQVEMEHIELDLRKRIDLLEDEILVPEMAGNVQHNAPPGEAGVVDDHPAREWTLQLREGGIRAVHAFGRIGLDADALGRNRQAVRLLAGKLRQESAPAGEGTLAHDDFHVLRGRRTVTPLERNGRRENPKRHNQREEDLH